MDWLLLGVSIFMVFFAWSTIEDIKQTPSNKNNEKNF